MHAEGLLYSIHVPSLVLIVQAIILLEGRLTDRHSPRQTRLNALAMPAANYH